MHYYKHMDDSLDSVLGYESSDMPNLSCEYIEIDETEYTEAIDNLRKINDESEQIDSESRIAELEKENAELKSRLNSVNETLKQFERSELK